MPNITFDKFRDLQVQSDERIVRQGEDNIDPQPQTGNLFGKIVSVLGRSDEERTANNDVTQAFFDTLKEEYGDHIAGEAIKGYESRTEDGKPLTARRIKAIIERAETVKTEEKERLLGLLRQDTPRLLQHSLDTARLVIPDHGPGSEFREVLLNLVAEKIRQQEGFQNPGKLPSRDFAEAFQAVVDEVVKTHREGLTHIAKYEEVRGKLLGPLEQDSMLHSPDWKGANPEDLKDLAFQRNDRRSFLVNFRAGGPGSVEQFVRTRLQTNFDGEFGKEKPELLDYERMTTSARGRIGPYAQYREPGFTYFSRIELGTGNEHSERDEKYHISVHPEDMAKAYEALAPLLVRDDCPIKLWKVVDLDDAKKSFETKSDQLHKMYQGTAQTRPEDWQKDLEYLEGGTIQKAKRLYEGDQFTLYIMEGQSEEEFGKFLSDVERTLSDAGVRSVRPPDSDESMGTFLSFRVGTRTTVGPDGAPTKEYVDPHSPNYGEHKATFGDNPYYQVHVGITFQAYREHVDQMRDALDRTDTTQTLELMHVAGKIHRLGETIRNLNLPDPEKSNLLHALDEIGLTSTIVRNLGVSGRVPQEISRFVQQIPAISQLAVEIAEGRQGDPDVLRRLQSCLVAFDEMKRDVRALEDPPEQTLQMLEFFEDKLQSMTELSRNSQRPTHVDGLVSELTHGHLQDPRIGEPGQRFIDDLGKLPFLQQDRVAQAKAAQILDLAGRILVKSTDLDLPLNIRLRMAGELRSLETAFRELIGDWPGRIDPNDEAGQDAMARLTQLNFEPDLSDVQRNLRQMLNMNNEVAMLEVPELLRDVGAALEAIDRGLPLDQLRVKEEDGIARVAELAGYLVDDHRPIPGTEPGYARLKSEVERLKQFVDNNV